VPRLPNLFVIGAAKAGTTSLARWLDDHPHAAVAPAKEVNFFSYDGLWSRGIDWYADQFDGLDAHVLCDASPSYLPAREAPARLAGTVPQARLVALLRDPVERAYAHYWWLRNWGAEDREFLDVVRAEVTGELTPLGCVDPSRYVDHLERYAAHFPREQLLVLAFDELSSDPAGMFGQVCDFAGLDRVVPTSVGTAYNPSAQVRSRRLWRWAGRRRERSWRDLPRGVDRLLVRYPDRPPMEPEARKLLAGYFAPYDESLRSFWGRTTLPWDIPA
jgi:hypothetical protein